MMATQTATVPQADVINGVDVTRLQETVEAVRHNPEIGKFRFRASNTWLGGDHNRSTIDGYYGACAEHDRAGQPFVIDNAEPPVLLGNDAGANPVEHLLNALAACMTTTMAYHAAARGIAIGAIDTELEGALDLRGFLNLAPDVRKGYQSIHVRMHVQADADPKLLRELTTFSPVYDVVSRSVPVDVVIVTY
jgi:uncharacterized OsmC-like protein